MLGDPSENASFIREPSPTFALDAQRRVVIAPEPVDGEAEVVDAARVCPNFAIEVRRGGERLV